jgi:transposase
MGKVKYNEEMKLQTVKYVLEGGKSATKVAKELGIDTNTVCRWEWKIRRIMRENGFYPQTRKKWKPYRKAKVMVCIARTRSNATFCPIDLMNSGQEILPISPPTWGGFILPRSVYRNGSVHGFEKQRGDWI